MPGSAWSANDFRKLHKDYVERQQQMVILTGQPPFTFSLMPRFSLQRSPRKNRKSTIPSDNLIIYGVTYTTQHWKTQLPQSVYRPPLFYNTHSVRRTVQYKFVQKAYVNKQSIYYHHQHQATTKSASQQHLVWRTTTMPLRQMSSSQSTIT